MARLTAAATAAKLEAKALAASSKSEGMRTLYDAGYSVAQVTKIFGVGYAFAYGVAKRAGKVETAAARRAPRRATAKGAKPVTKTAKAPAIAVRKATSLAAKPAAKVTKKPGRPTAARRLVNRKVAPSA